MPVWVTFRPGIDCNFGYACCNNQVSSFLANPEKMNRHSCRFWFNFKKMGFN